MTTTTIENKAQIWSLTSDILEKTLKQHESRFALFAADLDNISADIKKVEAYLKKHAICIPIFMKVRNIRWVSVCDGEYRVLFAEFISWSKDKNGNFRLMNCNATFSIGYEDPENAKFVSEDDIAIDTHFGSNEPIVTPLIETKAEVRRKIHPSLSNFIDGIINYLGMGNDFVNGNYEKKRSKN